MPLYDFHCQRDHRFERMVPLAQFHDPQKCDCGADARRLISAPRVQSDNIEPTWGADGKQHTSLASYRRSLRPDGNPKGERFIELGNETVKPPPPPVTDQRKLRDDIRAGIEDVRNGRVKPAVILED